MPEFSPGKRAFVHMETMLIDKLRLRFPDDLERDFREDYFAKSLSQLRFGILLGAILYALFGFLDLLIFPEVRYQTWFIRYVVVIPSCIALLLFSRSSQFKKYIQISVFVVVLVSGAGIIAMMVIVQSPVNYFHFAGLLLIIMYSYTFSKMRFLYTVLASWALVVMYNISAFWIFPLPISVILNDNFFYIAANLIGMFSSYNRELYMRRDFYQNRIVQDLEVRKHLDEKEKLHEAVDKAMLSFRESEARFRTLAETTTASIIIHRGGRFLYTNPHVQKTTGYTQDEFLSMNFWEIIHPDFRDFVRQRGQARLSGSAVPDEYEFKIVAKNGDTRWVNTTAGVIIYEGEPAIIATLFDITARKQAEEEREQLNRQLHQALQSFKESEAKFRTLAETTTAAIFIHQGGRILYANPAGKSMVGYTNEEFMSMDFWSIIHPDFQDMVRERGQARLRGQVIPPQYEFKVITKNGEVRWVYMTAGVIEYEGKPAIIGTLFDITDLKRAEEEKVRLYEERIAEERRHVMEKEKLLMDLHDGVGGITTNINILSEVAQKAGDIESIKETLATISGLSREGISEIRSFMQSLDTRELNWRTLATELRSQGTNMVEPHNIAFMIETATEDIPEQPGSLLWVNLFKIYKEALTNVIKHSKARAVAVTLRVDRDGLVLAVQDDGTGWRERPSSGRGLSNMKKRAEEIGGQVSFSSDKGTRVNIEIPIPLKYPVSGMES
jgi:PAS domain S-box-containing protein